MVFYDIKYQLFYGQTHSLQESVKQFRSVLFKNLQHLRVVHITVQFKVMHVCKRVPKTAHEIISYQLYMLFLIHHSILLEKFLLTCIDVLWLLTKSYLKDMLFFVKEKRFVKSLILIKRLFLYDFGNGFLWNLATLQ